MSMRVMLLGMLPRIDIDMNDNLLTRNLIRLAIFVASLLFFINMMSAQRVYVTDNPHHADYICYVTGNVFTADWIIYETDNQFDAADGRWFITDNRFEADFIVCYTNNQYLATRTIFTTRNKFITKFNQY